MLSHLPKVVVEFKYEFIIIPKLSNGISLEFLKWLYVQYSIVDSMGDSMLLMLLLLLRMIGHFARIAHINQF